MNSIPKKPLIMSDKNVCSRAGRSWSNLHNYYAILIRPMKWSNLKQGFVKNYYFCNSFNKNITWRSFVAFVVVDEDLFNIIRQHLILRLKQKLIQTRLVVTSFKIPVRQGWDSPSSIITVFSSSRVFHWKVTNRKLR